MAPQSYPEPTVGALIFNPEQRRYGRKKDLPIKTADERLKQRRVTGITIYALASVLALTYMVNRNQPVNTFLDVIAWIGIFFALSFLIWLVPMALFARYMEVSGEYEESAPMPGKAD